MVQDYAADPFLSSGKEWDSKAEEIIESKPGNFDAIVLGIHAFNNRPANN
jgi:hypothetical protein